ncbi:MAG TPA: hypothetical protein VMU94_00890 [Streptosporangiaceae bacterium]|nr:hypothetical protein [Streptosporangiaceae bacterium]
MIAALLLTGCAGASGQPGAAGRVSPARRLVARFCPGRPPGALTTALTSTVPVSLRGEVVPLGISADGATAYLSAWTRRFAGVAALSLATGALHPIARFGNRATGQADGAWGGRWLVWEQTYSLSSLDGFTVFAWDSVTGRLVPLGHSLDSPAGAPWPSPWHAPAVSGYFAAWAQGYGPGGLVEIRLADLRTGRVSVIARGHVQAPFFDGGLLVWPASGRPGALTRLHAYATATGRPAPLPAVLRPVRGTDFVATDGTRTAYLDPGLTSLYYSPAPGQAASVVLRAPPGISFSNIGMAQGAIAWTTTRATYLASTATGGYVQVTPEFGFAVTDSGPDVLVSDAPARKAAHPRLALHVLDAAGIDRGAC